MKKKYTIIDVAREAEVSVATVSRVINQNYPVSPKTRNRVQKVIDEFHFIPNMQAQEIKKRKSNTIGIIVPSVDNMFFPEVINGVEHYLMQHKYSLLLSFSKNNKEKEQENVRNLVARNVAGIIIADANTTNVENGFYEELVHNIPITFINGDSSNDKFSYVMCDEQDGAKKALTALWSYGHRDIYFIRGEHSYSYDVKEQAYREFLEKQEEHYEAHVIEVGEGNRHTVIDTTCEIMVKRLQEETYSAAFCCNDLMAIGVLDACKKLGIAVPEEFSVIGFDNIILSRLIQPKLTTMDQNMYQLGMSAAQLILENIHAEEKLNKKVVLTSALVERETLAKKNR